MTLDEGQIQSIEERENVPRNAPPYFLFTHMAWVAQSCAISKKFRWV